SASLSMVPSAAIHSRQPGPHALASPRAMKKAIDAGSRFDLVSGGVVRVIAGDWAGPGARWAPAGVAIPTPRAAAIRRRPRAIMPSGSSAKVEAEFEASPQGIGHDPRLQYGRG